MPCAFIFSGYPSKETKTRQPTPTKIHEWTTFPTEQASIWEDLMGTEFATVRHFSALLALKEYGKEARGSMVSSELGLPSSTHSQPKYLRASSCHVISWGFS
jgi:hypothetical protein